MKFVQVVYHAYNSPIQSNPFTLRIATKMADKDNGMFPDVSDEHLVREAQAGNRDAFQALYNRYLKKVYNRVKSRVPFQDAEDITQEVFIAVARSLPSFEERSRFNTWLYTIVNRQIVNYYRASKKTDDETSGLDNEEVMNITEVMLDNDDVILLQQTVNTLPDHYQEIVLMRFADGLSFAEIAERRGQSLEATKSLFRRAIQAIADKMGRE